MNIRELLSILLPQPGEEGYFAGWIMVGLIAAAIFLAFALFGE